ncbi:MAG: bifunctional YncE family protein/alkaline phosphatase family protein [Microthrixaceae bacterium]
MRRLSNHPRALAVLAGLLFISSLTVVGVLRASTNHRDNDAVGANASRFLELTGDGADAAGPSGSASGELASDEEVGSSPELDGVPRTPAGWALRPAGKQIDVLRFPLGLAPSADGSSIVVSSDSGGPQGLTVIDTTTLAGVPVTAANLFMGVATTPSGRIYASGGNADRIFRWQLAGPAAVPLDVTGAQPFPIQNAQNGRFPQAGLPAQLPASDGIGVPGYPGHLLLDGTTLYVASTVSEPSTSDDPCPDAQALCSRVTIIDTTTDTILGRVPVGLDAFGLAIDSARQRLYVSNWADEAGRGATGEGDTSRGTVSVVDVSDPTDAHEIGSVTVGHHPSAVQLSADGERLFVANTNDDTISVLDVSGAGAPTQIAVESVAPAAGTPVGAHPDAFALSPDGQDLYIALAGLNAVEVRDGATAARIGGTPRYIPTGWYPSALAITGDADSYRLWVANAKGMGPGAGGNGSVLFQGSNTNGTVSAIDLPATSAQLETWSEEVRENDHLDRVAVDACTPAAGIEVSEVLCPKDGDESPIKHVVYIVTENKTFDQYFGDINTTGGTGFDAEPALTLYGQPFTPNRHALASRYSLSDRFFSDAEVSVTGHSYTSGGIATDHNERTWPADYDEGIRGNRGGGDPLRPGLGDPAANAAQRRAEDELDDPEGGYIFEAFKEAGATPPSDQPGELSMAIYGESTALESGNMDAYKAPRWKEGDLRYFDTCRAAQFISGAAPDNGPVPDGLQYPDPRASVPLAGQVTANDCEGRTLPPQFTLAHWTDVYNEDNGRDVMPSFIYMTLPVNHTMGANLGSPTPQSMVADNDVAVGMIVEALSRSPFWDSTAVFVTEDDTQVAADHVSSLRDYLQVISPWARPGANHQWGSMGSLLRTVETIFDIEPFSINDRTALPQHGAFVTHLDDPRDTAPYDLVPTAVPFALNQPGTPGQAQSEAMDFSTYDLIDEHTLNAILYAIGRGTTLEEAEAFLAANATTRR